MQVSVFLEKEQKLVSDVQKQQGLVLKVQKKWGKFLKVQEQVSVVQEKQQSQVSGPPGKSEEAALVILETKLSQVSVFLWKRQG